MPFTPAHVAAVLPIAAAAPHALPFSALVIGSMIPDLPLFVPLVPSYSTTHSIAGIFTACVLLGLLCLLIFQCLMKEPLFALLPDAVRSRCARLTSSCVELTAPFFASSSLAVAVGAATHVFWDSFTHRGRWGTTVFPALNKPTLTIWGHEAAGYKLIQYGSTIVFLPLVLILLALWLVRQEPTPLAGLPALPPFWRATVALTTLVVPLSVALAVWALERRAPYLKLGRAITASGLALGTFVLIYCAGYHIIFGRKGATCER